MTTPKSVKTACIVSLVITVVWFLVTAVAYTFQESYIAFFMGDTFEGKTERIFLAYTAVCIASAAIVAACNILMIYGKTTLIPLVLSGFAAVFTAPAANTAHSLQVVLSARLQGADAVAKTATFAQLTGYISYILDAAIICTACASAVYAYAKKKGQNNENT